MPPWLSPSGHVQRRKISTHGHAHRCMIMQCYVTAQFLQNNYCLEMYNTMGNFGVMGACMGTKIIIVST